jgi:hypothetical protein
MPSTVDETRSERLARLRQEADLAGQQGEAWLEKLAPELVSLPRGTVLVINCATGEYVTAPSHIDALHQFQKRFGNVRSWMHEIGGGFFVGGGIV